MLQINPLLPSFDIFSGTHVRPCVQVATRLIGVKACPRVGGGGGSLLTMDYTGRLRPKGVPFFRLEVYKRVGISRVKVQKRAGKTVL